MANLFNRGTFQAHSGDLLTMKIDCDAFTPEDWFALAEYAARILLPPFWDVFSVPQTHPGIDNAARFADALTGYAVPRGWAKLVVDDVLTTGKSITARRDEVLTNSPGRIIGLVVVARGPAPSWVVPILNLNTKRRF